MNTYIVLMQKYFISSMNFTFFLCESETRSIYEEWWTFTHQQTIFHNKSIHTDVLKFPNYEKKRGVTSK